MDQITRRRKITIGLLVGGVIGLILISTIGGYFFWKNRQSAKTEWQAIPKGEISEVNYSPVAVIEKGDQMQAGLSDQSIKLSEGKALPQTVLPVQLAQGTPLSQAEIEQIASRLPELPKQPHDQVDFKLPTGLIPPPRTGETIKEAFPPSSEPIQPGQEPTGPLQVLRYSPVGDISIAPFVSITFNQPMVPLATIKTLSNEQVPVKITPELPGTWRWIGTKSLTFNVDSNLIDRLPKATDYQVTIPAGTKSAIGGVLLEEVSWSFSTPPVQVMTFYPSNSPQSTEPLFFISFDQRIEVEAVFKIIQVSANGKSFDLKLVSQDEIEKDASVKNLVKNTLEGRWIVFKTTEPLPKDSQVNINVGPGIPSAEGPRLNNTGFTSSFRTYASLRIMEHGCSWYSQPCPPLSPFYIRFNNPIDASKYQDSYLRIQPELPGVVVNFNGETVVIQGASQGQTTYTIEVSSEIQDIYGQKLGKNQTLTFRTGTMNPILRGPDKTIITLDPSLKKPVFSVYTINFPRLEATIYSVTPSDWSNYQNALRTYYYDIAKPLVLPGKKLFEGNIPVEAPADKLTQVDIALTKYLDEGFGHFIIVVQPPENLVKDKNERYSNTIITWVQVTQIGLDAFIDNLEIIAWTTKLKDGTPLTDIEITDSSGTLKVITDEEGIARFPITEGTTYLVASHGKDQCLLPSSTSFWSDYGWHKVYQSDELRWYLFNDRGMYRPGEEVFIKGWLRKIGAGKNGDVSLVGNAINQIHYRLTDSQGNDLGSGSTQVTALGGFDFSFKLPEKMNLGYTQIYLDAIGSGDLNGRQAYHAFQVQEFRRPEFEVKARNESPAPYFAGESAVVAVEAKYYAGDPLPNAEVNWQVNTSPGHYTPPNWDDFTFGYWEPWWYYRSGGTDDGHYGYAQFSGFTDASGTHFLKLNFAIQSKPRPRSIQAVATVMDVNRQAWTGSTTLLVHPASLYVGMKSDNYFVQRGTPLNIALIVTDLDGNPVADRPITVQAARLEWTNRSGQWEEIETDIQVCTIGSKVEPVQCTFETPLGGVYRITATITDTQGRLNQSQFTRWVSGGQLPPTRNVEMESVTLIPDRESYQPGDSAQILVQSPFTPAEGLLTVSRNGILYSERFHIQDGTTTLKIVVQESYIPNLNIQVDLVGYAPRTDDKGEIISDLPPRPAYASGTLNLSIPPLARKLSVELEIEREELEPGGKTNLDLVVKDRNGQPIPGAELAVVVVDEAILALTNYQMVDPLSIFYTERSPDVISYYSRAMVILANPQALLEGMGEQVMREAVVVKEEMVMATAVPAMAPMARDMAESAQGATQPIQVRTDFNPLALFAPAIKTDEQGHAQVQITVPDNLTRYRVMVVAVDEGKKFGKGEASITARLPIMVRPSAPRFLNFGDKFELPVVIQNQTGEALLVDVIARASNLELTGEKGWRVEVPAHNRVEVRFPGTTISAGTARLQVAAVSGSYADAANISLPVYTPATTEAFATYGIIDQGSIIQPVASPQGVFPQYGGLEIQTSSTAVQALTDAVLYLVSYPFECSEQLASRILAVAGLRDVLAAFKADGLPQPSEMEAAVQRDILRLQGMQNTDGGFPYWRKWQESIPFNSIHVANALQRAEMKGYSVPQEMKTLVLGYLQQIENHYPDYYSQNTRLVLSAYALNVRALMGDRDVGKALKLLRTTSLEKFPMEAIGWLWTVISADQQASSQVEAIRTYVNNQVVETAGAANFITSCDEQKYLLLSSDRRTDAILLDALMIDQPGSDLIPKLVNGLLAHRVKGRWSNTQENVFVLLALDRYFNTYEAQTPDFVARIWLGEGYAGEHSYQGYTTERHETIIPMSYLVDQIREGETANLLMFKEGAGRLYYRLGLRYAPQNLNLPPLDMGFVVQRRYEAVDNPDDVIQAEDGTWIIKAGTRVRVKLTLVVDTRRYHVALADPLPAGLEIQNPELAVTGGLPPSDTSVQPYGWWWWNWFEHQNLRDERAEAFTTLLWEGLYEYTYITRATTPGTFIVPPAKAEEMYSPEVFGRSASDLVIIK